MENKSLSKLWKANERGIWLRSFLFSFDFVAAIPVLILFSAIAGKAFSSIRQNEDAVLQ